MSKEAVHTKSGQLVYAYAKKLMAMRDEIEIALYEFHRIIKRNLIIGGSTIPGEYILPKIVGSF